MTCRICLESEGEMVAACKCKGYDIGYMHQTCLRKWVETSGRETCEICSEPFEYHEKCGCSPQAYFVHSLVCTPQSSLENILLGLGSLMLFVLFIIASFLTPGGSFAQMAGFNTYSIVIAVVCLQIYDRGKTPYFILNVTVVWKFCYTLAVLVSTTIQSSLNEDNCALECALADFNDSYGCFPPCPFVQKVAALQADYDSALLLNLLNAFVLLCIRNIVLCFTHKRKRYFVEYSGKSDEEVALLSSSSESVGASGAISGISGV